MRRGRLYLQKIKMSVSKLLSSLFRFVRRPVRRRDAAAIKENVSHTCTGYSALCDGRAPLESGPWLARRVQTEEAIVEGSRVLSWVMPNFGSKQLS